MDDAFRKPYKSVDTEPKIYELWEKSGMFNPDNLPDAKNREPFSIVLPPPNVTGRLHMGHALILSLEDIIIRFKRMRGYRTLWLPGTDHAAIATQSVVEKRIQKEEKLNRHDLGRDELLKRIEKFANESHDTIISQIKTMGASVDWSREVFTLDQTRSLAVRTMFKKMYDAGLIYRSNRIVNWDPKGQTTISDDEIVYKERSTTLYTFRYSKDFPIPVATTRPETKVGDVAVAVHPDDTRYKDFIGKEYNLTFCDVPIHIKVVADYAVDMEFGTGAVGVTPAHSQTDWDIAERHNLPRKQIINEYAKMTVSGRLENKKVAEAREMVVAWLREENLLEEEQEMTHNVSTAERTGGTIEPLPKLQWFIDVNKQFTIPNSKISGIESGSETTLKEMTRKAVESGDIKILPEHFVKTYFHWIDNLRPWCISRQIWYGHRIPVWYRGEEIYVGIEEPSEDGWKQDPDTLDTWFSSGLWTFSTMGWPEAWDMEKGVAKEGSDLAVWRPTDILETGHDILFFWVARMVLMTGFALGEIPFKTVYLNGLVRDAKGRKMSKSLGNNLDPLDVTEKFGTDATRMALVVGNAPGMDTRISEEKIKGYKHFANKLWNISRFILERTDEIDLAEKLSETDAKIYGELSKIVREVSEDIDAYRIHIAAEKLYHFTWHRLADEILEESKPILLDGDEVARASRARLLRDTLDTILKLLHPFMPFITEEIWQRIPNQSEKMLMTATWPS